MRCIPSLGKSVPCRLAIVASATLLLFGGCSDDEPPAAKTTAAVGTPGDPVTLGKELYTRLACAGCHSLDGTRRVGPSFLDLYGTTVRLGDGAVARKDDAYLRDAILAPASGRVEGYSAQMPSYRGKLTDVEVDALVAMIKASTTRAR